jgi:hypothetical protein
MDIVYATKNEWMNQTFSFAGAGKKNVLVMKSKSAQLQVS